MTMESRAMTYCLAVKEFALKNGVYATYITIPIFCRNDSGMHVDELLFKGDRNAFFNKNDEYHLFQKARQDVASLLKPAFEITVVTNRWVNSYECLVLGYE